MTAWYWTFWLCVACLAYVYVGYPLAVAALARLRSRPVTRAEVTPSVTVLIAAFNEARIIEATVRDKLAQDYPAALLDVIVVSDGSTDGTDAIVRRLESDSGRRVRLVRQEREGKTRALNRAARLARGEVLVVADANSRYAPDTVRSLVQSFADPKVGYVTGRMVYTNPDGSAMGEGSGRYMSYENGLRGLEARVGSVVGVDGGVDAVRRALYQPMRADALPDFVLPLSVVERGFRVVYEPTARVFEPALGRARDEFRMRVRVALRAMWTLWEKRALLNPLRHGLFAWQLASHKALRYAAFVPLALVLAASAALAPVSDFHAAFLGLQIVLYGCALFGHLSRGLPARESKLLVPYYFVLLNAACLVAAWRFLRGQRIALWTPRVGV